jgi:hypothetical protein
MGTDDAATVYHLAVREARQTPPRKLWAKMHQAAGVSDLDRLGWVRLVAQHHVLEDLGEAPARGAER